MHTDKSSKAAKMALACILAALVLWMLVANSGGKGNNEPQTSAGVPQQGAVHVPVPAPVGTEEPPPPGITPSWTPRPPTPTVHVWSKPVPVSNVTTSVMSTTAEVGLGQQSTIDRTESISQLIWAPTGDKLLYLTQSGNLYWSEPDGSNATLLRHYDEVRLQLDEQYPMTNTLLILNLGAPLPDGSRAPSHLDVIKFTPGQPPTLQDGPDLPHTFAHLRWWSPTRASGWTHTGEDGADLLVTVDQDGNLVSEINVPYLIEGAVQPGGEWLAYSTTYQVTDPVDGTTPNTGYLLNLNTGQRLQITPPGGGGVGNWSPDGNWFLADTSLGVSLVSADGQQWITIPDPDADHADFDAVWSPDSKYLAYAILHAHMANEATVSSWTGSVHVVNVPARQVTNLSPDSDSPVSIIKSTEGDTLLMQPKWSRDSKIITFLSLGCDDLECSGLSPAVINMAVKK